MYTHFLQQYSPLLKAFTSQGISELTLLLKIQEYCYDNIHFMKAFQKIVVLLYKGELCAFFAPSIFCPVKFFLKQFDCVRLLLFCCSLQLMSWTKSRFWSGTMKPILPKEKAFSLSRWNHLLSGSRMQKKVSTVKNVCVSVKAKNLASFFSCWASVTCVVLFQSRSQRKQTEYLEVQPHLDLYCCSNAGKWFCLGFLFVF